MKLYMVKLSPLAKIDLSDIWEYLFEYDESIADAVLFEIQERIFQLRDFPFLGAMKEGFSDNERFLVFQKYNIFYRIEEDEVFIRRILHGAREVRDLIFEK